MPATRAAVTWPPCPALLFMLCSWAVHATDLAVHPLFARIALTRGKAPEQHVPEACAACGTMLSALYLQKCLVLSHAATALQATVQCPERPCLAAPQHAAWPAWAHIPVSPALTLPCDGTARDAPHGCSLLHCAGREA